MIYNVEQVKNILTKARTANSYPELKVATGLDIKQLVQLFNNISKDFGIKPELPLKMTDEEINELINKIEEYSKPKKIITKTAVKEIEEGFDLSEFIPSPEREGKFKEREIYKDIVKILENGFTPYLIGVAGTGKTTFARWFGQIHHLPTLVVNCDMGELRGLLGHWQLVETEKSNVVTKFKIGILTQMLMNPCVVLFDEVNTLESMDLFFLHELLNNRRMFIREIDMVVDLHRNAHVILASNPVGAGYLGTKRLNVALLSRIVVVEIPVFTESELKDIIQGLDDSLIKLYVEVNKFLQDNKYQTAFSIRELLQISRLSEHIGLEKAITYSFLNKAKQTLYQEELDSLITLISSITGLVFNTDKT